MKTLRVVLVFAFLFIAGLQMPGQEKVNVSMGIGFPETLNLGVRYQVYKQSQVGFSIGTWPSPGGYFFDWNLLLSLSSDFYYHFIGSSKLSDLAPWYVRMGVGYIGISYDSYKENNVQIQMRLGRDFYLTRNNGLSVDFGMTSFVYNETGFTSLLPACGASLFVRF